MPDNSPQPSFDPAAIPPFSVIRLPVFLGGKLELKRMVVIAHISGHVFAVKPTSRMERFGSDQSLLQGIVIYEVGETAVFDKKTAIEPDNQFPISHKDLARHHRDGKLEVLGQLPPDFCERLKAAIKNSRTISGREKTRLAKQLP